MNEAQRVLEILLKLKADAAGAQQVNAALKSVETQAVQTAAAVNRVATGGAGTGQIAAMQANAVQYQTAVTAQKEQQLVIEQQQKAIVVARFDLVAAEVAGDKVRVALLREELLIRNATLQSLRLEGFTAAELNKVLQAQNLLLTTSAAKQQVMTGQTALTRGQATSLAQQLATGRVSAESLSRTLSGLGGTLTLAGLGAFTLYNFVKGQVDESRELNKEWERIVAELNKASVEWDAIASRAESFGDQVKLAEKVKKDLDQMSKDMEAFRTKELPLWQKFWDGLFTDKGNIFDVNGPLGRPNRGPGPYETQRDTKVLDETNRKLDLANEALDLARDSTDEWAAAQTNVGESLVDYTAKLNDAKATLSELDAARHRDGTPEERQARINAYEEQLQKVTDLTGKVEQLGESLEKTNKKSTADARRDQQQEINASLREQQNLIERIHQQQQLINANPFLSASEKQALTLASMSAEMLALGAAIDRTKQRLAHSVLDPVTHERLQAQLQKDKFEFDSLRLKIEAINRPLSAQLMEWVNNFGTASQQVAGIITGTLDSAIQQVSSNIAQAIWRTGKLEDVWISLGETATQQLIEMGLQMGIQFIASEARKAISTSTSVTQSAAVTAAATPAAVAESGATGGFNWVAAGIAAAAAIALIGGLLAGVGAFARGGRTGRGPRLATVGEEGEEFVFTHKAAKNIGVDNLYAMMHAAERAPRFGAGGVASLPRDRGGIEPPILFGSGLPNSAFGGGPTVQVNWRGTGSAPYWNRPPATTAPVTPSQGRGGSSPSATSRTGSFGGGAGRAPYGDLSARFGPGSGAWNATQFTKYWEAGGQDAGSPNAPPAGDMGHTIFQNPGNTMRGQMDAEGSLIHISTFGSRVPGPASTDDNILAWLSTGERVIPADRNVALERRLGFDWDKKIAVNAPRFALGGTAGGRPVSASSSQRSASGRPSKLVLVNDLKAAIREAQSEPEYEVRIMDITNRNRHEIGLPPTQ